MIRQEAAGPVRQSVENTGDDFRELRVVLLQLGVNHVQFHRERGKDHHQRNKHDQADNAECEEGSQPVAIAQRGTQFVFHRVENDGQDRGPQNRREIG